MTDRAEPTDSSDSSDHPPHGTLGQEAAKLLEATQQWLGARSGRVPDGPWTDAWTAATTNATTAVTTDGAAPDCRSCPICRMRRILSELNPEVFAHLADAAASMNAAMKAMGTDVEGADEQRAGPP